MRYSGTIESDGGWGQRTSTRHMLILNRQKLVRSYRASTRVDSEPAKLPPSRDSAARCGVVSPVQVFKEDSNNLGSLLDFRLPRGFMRWPKHTAALGVVVSLFCSEGGECLAPAYPPPPPPEMRCWRQCVVYGVCEWKMLLSLPVASGRWLIASFRPSCLLSVTHTLRTASSPAIARRTGDLG